MKKSKWLFNIITLVLCVCAMAIGVYAAKQASLTANGQIGFKAHNCEVILNGTIDAYQSGGDTVLNKSQDISTYKTTGGKITNVNIGGTNGVSTLALPAMYFSDTGANGNTITLNLTTANQSVFGISAKISVSGTMPTGVTCAISEDNFVMGALNSTTDEKSFTITFTLSDPTTSADFGDTAFQVIMEFEKHTPPVRDYLKIVETTNSDTGLEAGCLYVEMGEYDVNKDGTIDKLKWYAFAKDNNGTMESFYKPTSLESVEAGTYYFISEYALGKSVFDADGAMEYYGSDLQQLMENLGDNEAFKISTYPIYKKITKRDLPSEVYTLFTSTVTPEQKFWAISVSEWELLQNHGDTVSQENAVAKFVDGGNGAYWLRSCVATGNYITIVLGGGIGSMSPPASELFYRPAFQLEIV